MRGSTLLRLTKWALIVAVAMLGVGLTTAHADTVFNVTGTFDNGATMTGTITINTVTGLVTAGSFNIAASAGPPASPAITGPWFLIAGQGVDGPPGYAADFTTVPGGDTSSMPNLDLVINTASGSLVGFTGGSFCFASSGCGDPSFLSYGSLVEDPTILLTAGNLTEVQTPEPATLLLLGTGFCALGLLRRKQITANA